MYKLYDEIIIVKNFENKGFVVNPDNKKQLENARKRASAGTLPKSEIKLKNEGFKISVLEDKTTLSENSLLCNCLVEKDGHSWIIGIHISSLISAFTQSICKNGVFQEEFFLAKKNNSIYILHDKMKEYAEALADKAKDNSLKTAKKTKKRIPGCNYITRKRNDIFLFEGYKWNISCFGEKAKSEKIYFYINAYFYNKYLYPKLSEYLKDADSVISSERNILARTEGNIKLKDDLTEEIILEYFRDKRRKCSIMPDFLKYFITLNNKFDLTSEDIQFLKDNEDEYEFEILPDKSFILKEKGS